MNNLRAVIITTALAFAIPAPAQDTAVAEASDPANGFSIMLTTEPCPDDMLAEVKAEDRDRFKFARERFEERSIRACWALNPPVVVIFDEDGDRGSIPMSAFKPVNRI